MTDAVWALALDETGLSGEDGPLAHGVFGRVVEDASLACALLGSVHHELAASGVLPLTGFTVLQSLLLLERDGFSLQRPVLICKHVLSIPPMRYYVNSAREGS